MTKGSFEARLAMPKIYQRECCHRVWDFLARFQVCVIGFPTGQDVLGQRSFSRDISTCSCTGTKGHWGKETFVSGQPRCPCSSIQVPFCGEKSVLLFRVAFFQSDCLQNPYFRLQIFLLQNLIYEILRFLPTTLNKAKKHNLLVIPYQVVNRLCL